MIQSVHLLNASSSIFLVMKEIKSFWWRLAWIVQGYAWTGGASLAHTRRFWGMAGVVSEHI